LTFDELPAGLDLQRGDRLTAYADLKKSKTTSLKKTKTAVAERIDYVLAGRHVRKVTRGEQTLVSF
jgi:hypothetical protein